MQYLSFLIFRLNTNKKAYPDLNRENVVNDLQPHDFNHPLFQTDRSACIGTART